MDDNTLAIHMNELRNHANHAKASFDMLNQSLENTAAVGVIYSLNNIMHNAAQISGMLWPTKARNRKRGEELRKVLGLPEKYPLNDRRLIEMFDREDEKLDEWISATKGKKVIFDYIGDIQALANEGVEELGIYRAYDPGKKIIIFRGVGFSLDAIANALMEVGSRIMTMHEQMFPEMKEIEEARQKEIEKAQKEAAEKAAAEEKPKKAATKKKAAPKKKAATKKAPAKKAASKKK